MPPLEAPGGLMPSFWDRLLNPASMGTRSRPGYSFQEMIDAVRADLEELLNTRQSGKRVPPEFAQVHKSIVTYGLPDFTAFAVSDEGGHEAVALAIEEVIRRFEPRLRNVRASVVKEKGDDRRLRIHLDARLNVDPAPEVGFETVVELRTGQASIQASMGRHE